MKLEDFKKAVVKDELYFKYIWYLLSLALIGVGIYCFYDLTTHPAKYYLRHSYIIAGTAYLFFLTLGCLTLYLLPNRYKVLHIESNFTLEKKKQSFLSL